MTLLKKIVFIFLLAFYASLTFSQNKTELLIKQFESATSETEQMAILRSSIKTDLDTLAMVEAVKYWENLISICKKSKYHLAAGYCQYNLALRLKIEGAYFRSYLAFQESKINYEAANDKRGLAVVFNGLGNLYNDLNNPDSALINYYKSAEYFKNLNDSKYGTIYLNIGGILTDMDSVAKAKKFLKESESVSLYKNDSSSLVNCFINLSVVYQAEENDDSANYYLIKSYEYSKGNVDISDKFFALLHLGEFYLNKGNVSQSKPFLTDAFNLAINQNYKNSIPLDGRAYSIKLYSKLFENSGDFKNAYKLIRKYLEYETESKIEQSNKELTRLQFDYTKKEMFLKLENFENKSKLRLWTMYISILGFFGSILLFFAFYRSYKHKKEANRLLTEMDELKNRLYSNITHELRTPLTLILGPLEQMLSDEAKKTPSHKQVKIMQKNANTLLNLVNQMLDLSKIDAKNMKLELVEEDINKFLRTHFAAFASLAEQKQITYQCSVLKEKNIRIFDAAKLEKIINNLLSNAIKFTRKNGNINCFVNFHQNQLELVVHDDGKGIPKDELEKIFDRFHQIEPNGETITQGTGIGLALTKELVEMMHGKITVESELGNGSKFTLFIPLGTEHLDNEEFQIITNIGFNLPENKKNNKSENTHTEELEINNVHEENDQLPHVLVVEDNKDIREFIAENLAGIFNVEQAKNGKTGLKQAFSIIPDLVITDVVMPKMDGIELCTSLKTDQKTSHIPVIMLTGKTGIDDRLKGLETGADAYMNKPFNIQELRLQASKLIEQRQKLRERFTRDLKLEPKDIAVTSVDEKFITRAMEIIEKNIGNSEYEVRQFEEEMFMSRMQLFRKIKALTNQTPGEFIRTIRLKRAASLIKQNFGNIAQVTFEVGFNNPSYFAKCFKDLYGVLPSEYAKNQQS